MQDKKSIIKVYDCIKKQILANIQRICMLHELSTNYLYYMQFSSVSTNSNTKYVKLKATPLFVRFLSFVVDKF